MPKKRGKKNSKPKKTRITIQKELYEIEEWIIERKKFIKKLIGVIVFIIILLIISNTFF